MTRSRWPPHWLPAIAVAVALGATAAVPAAVAPAGAPAMLSLLPLQPLIDRTESGGTLRLPPGRYAGRVQIDRPIALIGERGAVVLGSGEGSVIRVRAPDVRIESLTIERSGVDLPAMDSAILLERSAVRAVVRANSLRDNLFGVYVHGATDSLIENNTIVGRRDLRMAEAGDGVAIWNAPGTQVVGNTMRYGRDGIFVRISRRNVFAHNVLRDLRFGIHYMYTHDSRIVGNRSSGNHVAWAMMYSERIELSDNVSDDDRDHGLMLNTTNRSTVARNVVRRGREKCVFVYNANYNDLRDNWFEGCPIGIHFTAGSEGNSLSGNAFVGNRMQVKYVGTRFVDWARSGRGNYWSDNPAFDLDGNGIADRPYRPNDVMDQVLWTLPSAKALANSPAVQMVRLAQAKFPALYPGGVIDSAPLMRPVFTPPPVTR
jgi:nitrous oxidase accessory protein